MARRGLGDHAAQELSAGTCMEIMQAPDLAIRKKSISK
jgi:hypothetical protein